MGYRWSGKIREMYAAIRSLHENMAPCCDTCDGMHTPNKSTKYCTTGSCRSWPWLKDDGQNSPWWSYHWNRQRCHCQSIEHNLGDSRKATFLGVMSQLLNSRSFRTSGNRGGNKSENQIPAYSRLFTQEANKAYRVMNQAPETEGKLAELFSPACTLKKWQGRFSKIILCLLP